jgi:glycosyltransferase involved in cell wall biosynthesis
MKPTLSVITICFNNLQELLDTCRSVDQQSVLPDEHLVIDGSTNEEIVNWLLQHHQPSYRRWIHERDKGISDAFNKGIGHAKGELFHLLNAGDTYAADNAIETVLNTFSQDAGLIWLHSQYIQHRGDINVVSGAPFEKKKLWKGMRTVAHPSMFIKKQAYEKHGLYNTHYKIAMDYDMLVRIRDEKFTFIPSPLVYFAPGGASHKQFKKGLAEVKESHRKHIGYDIRQTIWQFRQRLLQALMETRSGRMLFQWKNRKKKADR